MKKPRYTIHFRDCTWNYYGRQTHVQHVDDGHAIRMYPDIITKHKPPRKMWHVQFPGGNAIKVYVIDEMIDGVMHMHCTPVNKNLDTLPEHFKGRTGSLDNIPPEVDKYGTPLDLSQAEET